MDKLNYLTSTHPNISFVVSKVSRFMSAPHLQACLRIVKYLKTQPRRGLFYHYGHLQVEALTNIDWAGSSYDKMVNGYCTFVCGNLVTWNSKKTRSSAEAE